MSSPPPLPASSRPFDSIAGLWKFACALAVLVGHNLVTVTTWRPDDAISLAIYRVVQFFSPLHFFFFSGYLAASALLDAKRPLRSLMVTRGLRIYVLVVAALAWGLLARISFTGSLGLPSLGEIWPLATWDGPIDFVEALRHLNPLGFADHVSFNYAVWYLYQEFRLVLLFPLFAWILRLPRLASRVGAVAGTWFVAAVLEYLLWAWFPLFRSSPFQTLGFGVIFLAGAMVWMELRPGGILSGIGRSGAIALCVAGVVLSYFESMGVRPPIDNPLVLILPVLAGQTILVIGLSKLAGNFPVGNLLRRACDGSVGIYIVHPPIHMAAAWWAIQRGSLWPIVAGILVSIAGGFAFHRWIERPSQRLLQARSGRTAR